MGEEVSGIDRRPPPGLPGWPSWSLSKDGQTVTIRGRHLTPTGYRWAYRLAYLAVLAGLIFLGWYYWGFKNTPPNWIRVSVNFVAEQVGYHLSFEKRKWVYIGLYAGCWILTKFWHGIFTSFLSRQFRQRSTLRFTAGTITVPRGLRRAWFFDRTQVEITFVLDVDPCLEWLLVKAQKKNSASLAAFYKSIRCLSLQYGADLVPLFRFAAPMDGQRFLAACRTTNEYQFKTSQNNTRETDLPPTDV